MSKVRQLRGGGSSIADNADLILIWASIAVARDWHMTVCVCDDSRVRTKGKGAEAEQLRHLFSVGWGLLSMQ